MSMSEDSYPSSGTVLAQEIPRIDSTKTDAQVASIEKLKSLECYEEELLLSENSGMSTFPNNRKHLCVTAAGYRVTSLLGSGPPDSRLHGEMERVCNLIYFICIQHCILHLCDTVKYVVMSFY